MLMTLKYDTCWYFKSSHKIAHFLSFQVELLYSLVEAQIYQWLQVFDRPFKNHEVQAGAELCQAQQSFGSGLPSL